MTTEQAREISDEIIRLYREHGGAAYAGEKVSQLEHMTQAAQLAEAQGFDEEVILAAFLHDIGHVCEAAGDDNQMDGFGTRDHEELGAEFLRGKGFSNKITRLVGSHVEAKRYLTYKDPTYYTNLSEASKRTLEYQGGPMKAQEASAFEQYPLFDLIIRLRNWDEQAKIGNQPIPDLHRYRDMLLRHLQTAGSR